MYWKEWEHVLYENLTNQVAEIIIVEFAIYPAQIIQNKRVVIVSNWAAAYDLSMLITAAAEGTPKGDAKLFCDTKYTKILGALLRQGWAWKDKSCVQCTFYMSSVTFLGPQNSPKSLAGFKGPIFKATTSNVRRREGRKREGRGRQNDLCPQAPETLVLPLLAINRLWVQFPPGQSCVTTFSPVNQKLIILNYASQQIGTTNAQNWDVAENIGRHERWTHRTDPCHDWRWFRHGTAYLHYDLRRTSLQLTWGDRCDCFVSKDGKLSHALTEFTKLHKHWWHV